ncbi:hypothetical protein JOB18_023039 [Solea senegalensis]|uniref:Uncharacterized protein n=1 Tax=Solea senegalensis TaxID=28829 RepID=A0AAV6Q9J0_SOLSE|nr:hypothetical protein JOB18_023039 [Solea senegalensis]
MKSTHRLPSKTRGRKTIDEKQSPLPSPPPLPLQTHPPLLLPPSSPPPEVKEVKNSKLRAEVKHVNAVVPGVKRSCRDDDTTR